MVMGWTEDFLLRTLTSTEKRFLRVSFHNDGYTLLEGGQKIPTPLPPPGQKHNIMEDKK